MQKSDMGFQRENILTTWVPREIADKRKTLADKLTSNPAITDVTFAADRLSQKDGCAGDVVTKEKALLMTPIR